EGVTSRSVIGYALHGLPQRRQALGLLSELAYLERRQSMQKVRLDFSGGLYRDTPFDDVGKPAIVSSLREKAIQRAENIGRVAHPLHGGDISSRGPGRIIQFRFADSSESYEEVRCDIRVECAPGALQ